MRTLILLSVFSLAFSLISSAQSMSEDKIKEIEQQRTEFVISFMKLTPEEAQKFKPLYQQYLQDLRKIHQKRKEMRKYLKKKKDSLSEEEAQQIIEQWLKLDERKQALVRKYYTTIFPQAIPHSKLILLPMAERKFKKELLKELKEKDKEENHSH
ncbi:MAG: hypothetical protein GXO48_01240 [Chlorobi bacterium]|nr:hypothetical protein [Chlorobiota bacterium]